MERLLAAAAMVLFLGVVLATCGPPPATDACLGRRAGDLVISELMIDPDGADTGGEWIELYNPLGTPLDLQGITIFLRDFDGANQKAHVLKAGTASARGYFVLGDVRGSSNPEWVDYSYGDSLGSMGNSHGAVGLRCGATRLDEVSYTRPAKSGRSRMLDPIGLEPDAVVNDDEARWCDAPAGSVYLAPNAGTPGAANPPCPVEASGGTCLEHGVARAIVPPRAGDLVITEVMGSPGRASDSVGEWFEVLARAQVDLNELTVQNGAGSTDTLQSTTCLPVAEGEYALLARSADGFVNGDLPPPRATYALSFSSGNERVILRLGDAGIDEVALRASSSGRAWQLDPGRLDEVSNDDPSSFCKAPNRWTHDGGGDFGSPGAENPPCQLDAGAATDGGAVTDGDRCLDPVTAAARAVRHPAVGDLVITEWLADPAAVADAFGEYVEVLVRADVDLNGVVLGDSSTRTSTVQRAGCVAVRANSWVLFARNDNPAVNGNLPPAVATFGFDLNNGSGDSIRLVGADGGLLDSVSYATARTGASTQLRVGLADPWANDLAGNLCVTPDAGTSRWLLLDGGLSDFGTPGRANVACP